MKIISTSKSESDVGQALNSLISELNEKLKKIDGLITKTECEISAGPSGAAVTVTLVINGDEPFHKEIIGVNEKGWSREHSVKKAEAKLNEIMKEKKGRISDVYVKSIVSPLPGRVYTTIVASINEDVIEEVSSAALRKHRIKKALELFNDDPASINVARVAEIFGVSRTMIYRDLESMGYQRHALKEEEPQP
ncbi:MAG: hypothetical protein ACE5HY_00445 [Candidatus Hydrothermarchaeales archaeon]